VCNGELKQKNFQCIGWASTWNSLYNRMVDRGRETSSVMVVHVYPLRIREVIDPLILGQEGTNIPDMDVNVEAKMVDGCNCMIYMCCICCNNRDH